jgi:hypothetical protein
MLIVWRSCGLILWSAVFGLAQLPLPDPASYKPTDDQETARLEKEWLQANDPRLVSWGAYLVAKDSRHELIPDLIEQMDLSRIDPAAAGPHRGLTGRTAALLAVLDALIRLEAQVPPDRIIKLHGPDFAAQRLILLARSPANIAALQEILESSKGGITVEWMVAADLLAAHPPPGFTNSILERFQPNATIHVTDRKTTGNWGQRGGGCACDFGPPSPVDQSWPKIRSYGLSLEGGTLFAPGVHAGFYWTTEEGQSPPVLANRACIAPGRDKEMFQGLLASLAQMTPKEFPLHDDADVEIRYQSPASYGAQLKAILKGLDSDFERVVSAYLRQGFLTPAEAEHLKLQVWIVDERQGKPARLLPRPRVFRWLKVGY